MPTLPVSFFQALQSREIMGPHERLRKALSQSENSEKRVMDDLEKHLSSFYLVEPFNNIEYLNTLAYLLNKIVKPFVAKDPEYEIFVRGPFISKLKLMNGLVDASEVLILERCADFLMHLAHCTVDPYIIATLVNYYTASSIFKDAFGTELHKAMVLLNRGIAAGGPYEASFIYRKIKLLDDEDNAERILLLWERLFESSIKEGFGVDPDLILGDGVELSFDALLNEYDTFCRKFDREPNSDLINRVRKKCNEEETINFDSPLEAGIENMQANHFNKAAEYFYEEIKNSFSDGLDYDNRSKKNFLAQIVGAYCDACKAADNNEKKRAIVLAALSFFFILLKNKMPLLSVADKDMFWDIRGLLSETLSKELKILRKWDGVIAKRAHQGMILSIEYGPLLEETIQILKENKLEQDELEMENKVPELPFLPRP